MTLARKRVLPWYKGEGREMENTSYMFVLLYVHLKKDFPFTLYQGNVVTYPQCFLTAYKSLVLFSWDVGFKNPDLYYLCTLEGCICI